MSEEINYPKTYEEYRALPASEQIKFMTNNPHEHGELLELMTNNFKYAIIDGHQVFQTDDGEFVEHVLMDEQYFVENWIAQFAIARVGERNYFDMESWNTITDGFTKGVIILDENKQPLFVITKFTDMGLNPIERATMTSCAGKAGNGKFIPDLAERGRMTHTFSEELNVILNSREGLTIPEMVPQWFYKKHNVDPLTMSQVTFIRDNFLYAGQPLDPDGDILIKVQRVLSKWNNEKVISDDDRKFILDVTGGTFNFDYEVNKVEPQATDVQQIENQPTEQPDKPFNMFDE